MELIIIIAAAGAVGGLIKSLAEQKGAVALPYVSRLHRMVQSTSTWAGSLIW